MTTPDLDFSSESGDALPTLPRMTLPRMFQLGLFQMGIGIMSVLTLAVINRVMISELAIPATVTAGAIAIPQLLAAPAKIWFGQLSDAKPLFGLYRSGYARLGAILFGALVFVAVQVMWQLGGAVRAAEGWSWNGQTLFWTAMLALVFACYGLATNFGSVPFATLLVDVTEEEERGRITAIAWSLLMVGIVFGAVSGSVFLQRIQADPDGAILTPIATLQGPINTLFVVVPLVVVGLAFLGTWGIEKRFSRFAARSRRNRARNGDKPENLTLGRALRVLTASRQTGFFFTFLFVMTMGLFMQEAVLEPYGGEVFGMTIAETTQLNAFWGIGVLLGLSSSGFLLSSRLGKVNTARLGCILVAVCFGLVILAGFTGQPQILQGAIALFGLAAGITTNGGISLMLDLTAAETAGTFIGAWGLSQGFARGVATVIGGAVLDVGKFLFSNPVLAYGVVFACQAGLMLVAIVLLDRIDVSEFKSRTENAILTVMEGDLDG